VLVCFCSTSGQLIGYHESVLTISRNASSAQKQLVTSIFNIPQRETLGKYLGYPVFQGRPLNNTIQDIISKATMKLEG